MLACAAELAEPKEATISVTEAKSLVDIVLHHPGFPMSSQYCEIANLDKKGTPFVADYYSFGASCDFLKRQPQALGAAYFVSPRTGLTHPLMSRLFKRMN